MWPGVDKLEAEQASAVRCFVAVQRHALRFDGNAGHAQGLRDRWNREPAPRFHGQTGHRRFWMPQCRFTVVNVKMIEKLRISS